MKTAINSALIVAVFLVSPVPARSASRDDLQKIIDELRTMREALAKHPLQPCAKLARIGSAQVLLNDLDGARATLAIIAHRELRVTRQFADKLASALAERGDVNGALTTVESVHWRVWEAEHCHSLLSVADAARRSGNTTEAKRLVGQAMSLAKVVPYDYPKQQAIFEVALAQIALGETHEAKNTQRLLTELSERTLEDQDDQHSARAYLKMGILASKFGDRAAAKSYFAKALRAISNQESSAAIVRHQIWMAQAAAGEVESALDDANAIQTAFQRERIFLDVAKLQWAGGDRAGFEKTLTLCKWTTAHQGEGLRLLAESYARNGEIKKALEVTERIEDDSQYAQAILGIAAILARHGDYVAAANLADNIAIPRAKINEFAPSDLMWGQRYIYRDPATWRTFDDRQTVMPGADAAEVENASELVAATMLCHVTLEGRYPIADRELLAWWDVLNVAKAQASGGDAASVLKWSELLPENRKLEALLGAAEGMAAFLNEKARVRPSRFIGLTDAERIAHWNDLAAEAPRGWEAARRLEVNGDEVVAMMREKITPLSAISEAEVRSIVADLDSPKYRVRESAERRLEAIGNRAEVVIRSTPNAGLSLEVQKRMRRVLESLNGPGPTTPEATRKLRAVAVVEHIGTPAAQKLLGEWAQGNYPVWFGRAARASLARCEP